MNKAELIDRLAPQLGGRSTATVAVDAMIDAIIREVAGGGTIGITGFGTFERVDRAPRTGRNPRTGAVVPIAGTSTPRFRAGTYFRRVVIEPAALPTNGHAGGRAGARTPRGSRRTRRTGPASPASPEPVNGVQATTHSADGTGQLTSAKAKKKSRKGGQESQAKEVVTGDPSAAMKETQKKPKQPAREIRKKSKKG